MKKIGRCTDDVANVDVVSEFQEVSEAADDNVADEKRRLSKLTTGKKNFKNSFQGFFLFDRRGVASASAAASVAGVAAAAAAAAASVAVIGPAGVCWVHSEVSEVSSSHPSLEKLLPYSNKSEIFPVSFKLFSGFSSFTECYKNQD